MPAGGPEHSILPPQNVILLHIFSSPSIPDLL